MSQDSPVIVAFRPLEILKQKPIATSFDALYNFSEKSEQEGIRISSIMEDGLEENTINRDLILEKLQKNGFLIKPCEKDSPLENEGEQDSDDENSHHGKELSQTTPVSLESIIEPSVEPINTGVATIGRKLGDTHVNLEDAVEKGMEIEKTTNEIEKENENSTEKEVEIPNEPKYSEDKANREISKDSSTVFILCSSKENENPPGKEPSEKIPKSRIPEFNSLAKIGKWRQMLCNSYDAPFTLDDTLWNNVDHFLIASQYRNYSMGQAFEQYENAVEIHKKKKFGDQKLKTDDDYLQREKQETFHALYAKFTQNPELARILEATKDAHLFYRVNKQKKIEFTELMWLRELLREYTRTSLKPLAEEPLDPVVRRRVVKEATEYDMSEVTIGEYAPQLPQYTPDVIKSSHYYMNNRTEFIKKINELYKKYGSDSSNSSSNGFDLLTHQKVVRDYLDVVTPYRGLLVYHNLGSGKSCTSIAVTEGMKTTKRIVILVPASLKRNYEFELQKCGDLLYKINQYWEFVSTEGKPNLIPVLAKALSMSTKEVKDKKGAWMVNVNKPSNFKTLSPKEQFTVREQVTHMINQKYSFLHYNANNLGVKIGQLKKSTRNPFDNTTIVIDEAHNLISRIIGNLKKKNNDSVYLKLYDMLMDANNLKVVMLSGTPIINYPQELAVLFNILRGYIYTWTFTIQVNTSERVNTDYIRSILDKRNCVVYDYIEYTRNTLVVTRNPYGFINVNTPPRDANVSQRTTKQADQRMKTPHNKTFKQSGGYGQYGVKLDDRGNIDNDAFKKQIIHILKDNDLIVKGTPKVVKEKCLPDDEKQFQEIFLKEKTDFSNKNDTSADVQHVQTLRRRILGLTSYFRSAAEGLLPDFVMSSDGSPFHEVRVPMSDYQFADYAKVRKVEIEKEKKSKKMQGIQRGMNNGELFQMASSYRVFSRTFCNFAFPVPPGRPMPQIKKGHDEIEEDADGSQKSEDTPDVESAIENDKEYEEKIVSAMSFLRENRDTLLSLNKNELRNFSPKMEQILKNIKNPQHKGLHLLYSNFVTMEGIGVFQEVLNANGFQEFKIRKENGNWVLDYEPDERMCYAAYTGNEDPEVREIFRSVFNGEWENVPETISLELRKIAQNNMYGEIVKLFMITAAGAEGINLRNTRYVHIMEPYWHMVRLEQVIGRARRINSHIALPKELQTVQVFLYMSVMSDKHKTDEKFKEIQVNDLSKIKENTPVTTDEYLFEISQMKQKINNQFLRVIKETAMDCHLYIQNHKKNEPLVCYGRGFAPDRTFVTYPLQKQDLQEDMNRPEKHAREQQQSEREISPAFQPLQRKYENLEDDDNNEVNRSTQEELLENNQMSPQRVQSETLSNSSLAPSFDNNDKNEVYTSPSFIEGVPNLAKTMFDDNIMFAFYSKSNDKPYPGMGNGEIIPLSKKPEYKDLSAIVGWRKMLSNFWIEPFELYGKKWNSVEHYYQASKFRKENPEFYHQFSLDSGSELSKDPNMAKAAGGKTGKVANKQFRPKTMKVDSDFFNTNRVNEEMYIAQYAKFTNPNAIRNREDTGEEYQYLADMLVKTKDAKLMYTMLRSTEKVFFENLVVIRDLIQNNKIEVKI